MEHLRELDSVKEGIGLRAFGQKDPLLEYKREAFNMFRELLDDINKEVVSMIWKSVPEVQSDELQQAQRTKSRFDLDKMKAQHQSNEGTGVRTQPAAGMQSQLAKTQTKPKPVVVEQEPGRNDHVKIQNLKTGEIMDIKWKHAQKKVDEEGWILVEK